MGGGANAPDAGTRPSRRLYVYNGGFLTQSRIRRILALSGWDVRLGAPGPGDSVGVWGASPTAPRGERVAEFTDAPVVRVEDAFLRSLFPGRSGEPPVGLVIDQTGVHFDPEHPSDLENLLSRHPLDEPDLLVRARNAIAFWRRRHLSKFAATLPKADLPDGAFALVIDQTRDDASVRASSADRPAFQELLARARAEHPELPILVKAHPETAQGHRPGHLSADDLRDGETLLTDPVSPAALFARAQAVYTVSSGLGFEAILHGKRPHVAGGPFYAGWGLSDDGRTFPRRSRVLSAEQLFAAAMILYPAWYDPVEDRPATLEEALCAMDTAARAWRDDRKGWHADAISRWKRSHLRRFFGRHAPVRFRGAGGPRMVWAGAAEPGDSRTRIEDGFLRSRGLGAALTPPVSLVLDDLGIYYDPRSESRLERLIAEAESLPQDARDRARALIAQIRAAGLSKYNTGAPPPDLPPGHRILVPGQVADDAGLLTAAGDIRTDAALLARVRARNPEAVIVYKPHPDVVAGFRQGATGDPNADVVVTETDPAGLLGLVDEVWTMTSLLGFEALLRGVAVITTGAPFYAGWGLTTDLGSIPARRTARPTLEGLAHAALIDYPRYSDPVTGLPIPPEAAVRRLASGRTPAPSGVLAWLQALRARRR